MPAPTPIAITGTIVDASGQPVEDVVVRLSPVSASSEQSEQAQGGFGVVRRPVEITTDDDGEFSVNALPGFRYRLFIEAIGFDRLFRCPSSAIEFHLLGLSPEVFAAPLGTTADGDPYVPLVLKVPSIAVVLERYDTLVVERGDNELGPFEEIATFDLRPGKTYYTYTDDADDGFYRCYYENSDTAEVSDYSDVLASEDEIEEGLVISVQELKDHYLFGVDLTDDKGTPYPESMFRHFIKSAVSLMEKELDIPIVPIEIEDELHDHYAADYGNWGWLKVNRYPVIAVRKLAFQYPSMQSEVVINSEWIITEDDGASGVLQIVPGRGSIADALIIPGSLMPLWSGNNGRVPATWKASYRAGFELGTIPADLKHAIAMNAALGPLNIAGDLLGGAGIASKSVSMPGLSQSINTTSSPMYAGYGARVIEYQKEAAALLPALKRFYGKSLKMTVG